MEPKKQHLKVQIVCIGDLFRFKLRQGWQGSTETKAVHPRTSQASDPPSFHFCLARQHASCMPLQGILLKSADSGPAAAAHKTMSGTQAAV